MSGIQTCSSPPCTPERTDVLRMKVPHGAKLVVHRICAMPDEAVKKNCKEANSICKRSQLKFGCCLDDNTIYEARNPSDQNRLEWSSRLCMLSYLPSEG